MTADRLTPEGSGPSMGVIGRAQELEPNLRRQAAARKFYRRAKHLQRGGTAITLVLALMAPVVLFLRPELGPTLGAVAGAWLFASRLISKPLRDRFQLRGAIAQELFDCDVLGLRVNTVLTTDLSEEEIRGASESKDDFAAVRGWYPTDGEMTWPQSVLTCQRSNAVWARRLHHAYAWLLVVGASLGAGVGVGVALIDRATLAGYLVGIALPTLPALLDASELARSHFEASRQRKRLELKVDEHLRGGASNSDLREIQDQLFTLRSGAPLVPDWFYRLLLDRYERDMRYAATQASRKRGG